MTLHQILLIGFAGATCWCAMGAIEKVSKGRYFAAISALEMTVDDFIPRWNDAPERTQVEVVAALRLAADRCDGASSASTKASSGTKTNGASK